METTQQEITPAAHKAMYKEYGIHVALILIEDGCNCIADVTSELLEQAMEQADRDARAFGAQKAYATTEKKTDTHLEVCRISEDAPSDTTEKNDTHSEVCRISESNTEEKNDTHSEVCRISDDAPSDTFELVIDNAECARIANTLHGRIKTNVSQIKQLYVKTLSAAVANGFVLHEMKRANPRVFTKHFAENGDMSFKLRTAQRYMKLAQYTLDQAMASGKVLDLQSQLSDYLYGNTSPTIFILGELLGAETLRQALIECGAIPTPQKKEADEDEQLDEQLIAMRSEAELEDEAWMEASRMVSNMKTYIGNDLVKLSPTKRVALKQELLKLIEQLNQAETETITID